MPSLLDDDSESLLTSFDVSSPAAEAGRVQPELLPNVTLLEVNRFSF